MKRKIPLLISLVIVFTSVLSFAGCGKKGNHDVSVWLIGNPEQNAYYETMFEEFGEKHGIKIDFQGFQHFEWETQIMKGLSGSNPPDVFQIGQDEIAFFSNPENDIIYDMKDYIQSDDFKNREDLGGVDENGDSLGYTDIQDALFNTYRYDRTKFGINAADTTFNSNIPFYGFSTGMIYQGLGYNVALLKSQITYDDVTKKPLRFYGENGNPYGWPKDGAGGISLPQYPAAQFPYGPTLPWELTGGETYTLDTFMTIVQCVSNYDNRADGQLKPIYGMDTPDNSWAALSWSAGSEIYDPVTKKIVWADDGNIEGITKLLDWVRLGRTGDKTQGISKFISSLSYEEWINQQIVFYTQIGSWESQTYRGDDSNFKEAVDYMPMPVKTAGDDWKGVYSSSVLAVHKNARDKEKAMLVASVFYTTDIQAEMVEMGFMFPMYKSTYEEYIKPENDDKFFPKRRDIIASVVSNNNGRVNNTVYTEDKQWWTIEFKNKYNDFIGGNSTSTSTAWIKDIAAKMQTTHDVFNK